jgi:electron transfer flavoprotein beta subunit
MINNKKEKEEVMEIIVCVKMIFDPEAAAHYVVSGIGIELEEKSKMLVPKGIETIISPFDELAAEAALRIKDDLGEDVKITAISIGNEACIQTLRRVLALGVDRAILIRDDGFEDANDYVTAHVLAAAIRKLDAYDLILCGRQAADVDSGVVGAGLAELLDIPSVTVVKAVRIDGGKAVVERTSPEESEIIEMPLPGLATISSELGEPRYPKRRSVIQARKKEIPVWTAEELSLKTENITALNARLTLEEINVLDVQGECNFLEGKTPEQSAAMLISKLREEKILSGSN